jgi:uncharacterized membrane protein
MHARPALRPHVALPSAARAWPTWAWVAAGGIGLGLADLAFAALYWFLHSGTPPIRIPQAIAGWVLGAHDARAGGIATALAGAALYCAIVAAMVAGYMRLASRWQALHANVAIAGGLYGLAMYALLFRVVLPLLAVPSPSKAMPPSWTLACLAAYAGIGIGCAWIARAKALDDR